MGYAAYLVTVGTEPGVYDQWWQCAARTRGVNGAVFKGYHSKREALEQFRQAQAEGSIEVAYKANDDGRSVAPPTGTQPPPTTRTVAYTTTQLPTAPSTPTSPPTRSPCSPRYDPLVQTVMSMVSFSSESEASRMRSTFRHSPSGSFSSHHAVHSTSARALSRQGPVKSSSSYTTERTVYEYGSTVGSRYPREAEEDPEARRHRFPVSEDADRGASVAASPAVSVRLARRASTEASLSPRTSVDAPTSVGSSSSRSSHSQRQSAGSDVSAIDAPSSRQRTSSTHVASPTTRVRRSSTLRFVSDVSSPESVVMTLSPPASIASTRRTEEVSRSYATSSARRIERRHTADVGVQARRDIEISPRRISRSHTADAWIQTSEPSSPLSHASPSRKSRRGSGSSRGASCATASRVTSTAASPAQAHSRHEDDLLPPLEELSLSSREPRSRRSQYGMSDMIQPMRAEYERGADPRSPIHASTSISRFDRPSPSHRSLNGSALFGP